MIHGRFLHFELTRRTSAGSAYESDRTLICSAHPGGITLTTKRFCFKITPGVFGWSGDGHVRMCRALDRRRNAFGRNQKGLIVPVISFTGMFFDIRSD